MGAVDAALNPSHRAIAVEADIVRRFLTWMQRAPAEGRAAAVSALARAYLNSPLSPAERSDAAVALTTVLDDPSAHVRRALAEALASASDAPRHIILALASDQSEVSRVVLARSPVLEDCDLVDCAAIGDFAAQTAVARRPRLGPAAAAALAEIGERPVVLGLANNLDAELAPSVLRRIFERFGEDAEVRETLLTRANLPAALRADIAASTARALAEFAADREWLTPPRAERIVRDAREQTIVSIARLCAPNELAGLVARLRTTGALTVALLMRALMSGDIGLMQQTLVELSGLPERRVAGFLRNGRSQGFAALWAKAGLPGHFLPAFRAALDVVADSGGAPGEQISHALTMRLIRACEQLGDPRLQPIVAMLWRFAGESGREHAREFAAEAAYAEPLPHLQSLESEAFGEDAPSIFALEAVDAEANSAPPVELDLLPSEPFANAA